MHAVSSRADEASQRITRRAWLAGILSICAGVAIRAKASDQVVAEEDEDTELKAVEALGEKAGLRPFRTSRTLHYLCAGDASDGFRQQTLCDCELVAADYLDHYRAKGFDVTRPARRLTVVALADDRSFAAYMRMPRLAMAPSRLLTMSIHGVYDPDSNRLIVFDHRNLGPDFGARAGYQNLRTLAHEATHQLTFNTGLLRRKSDTPTSVTEGLAVYGEVRKNTGRTAPGQINLMRLQDLAQTRRIPWIPVATLLSDDHFVKGAAGDQARLLAYSEAWLLVHYLMNDPTRTFNLRRYLEAIRDRSEAHTDTRLDVARQHLGDLDRLDQQLRNYAVRLQKTA